MKLRLHHVDAFADRRFSGNPAAVVVMNDFPADEFLRDVAAENNLSETAYVVAADAPGAFRLRWFTPAAEVDLCGHATLAAAWVLWNRHGEQTRIIRFATRSGELRVVRRSDGLIELDLPARNPVPFFGDPLGSALGAAPLAVFDSGVCYTGVFESEGQIRALRPDFRALAAMDRHGIIVTAPGDEADFVYRYFAPSVGVDEDPVTGSAQCDLIPYWTARLSKTELVARQVSRRGGTLYGRYGGERVYVAGAVVPYFEGEIEGA